MERSSFTMGDVETGAATASGETTEGTRAGDTGAAARLAALDLPTDRTRRAAASGRRGLARTLANELGDVPAGDRDAVAIAAFAAVLHRYANAETFALGVVDARGRGVVELDFADGPTFDDALRSVRAAARVAGALPQAVVAVAGTQRPETASGIDLWLSVSDATELALDYDADLYDAETAERLLGHLRTLLAAALADRGTPVSDLPLLGEAERALVLSQWNATARPFPAACIDELVVAQARRTPDAVAVASGTESLTFAELDRRSTALANHLRTLGVGPDVLVGIALDRSVHLLVGLLGILKAGGAYVPIDPTYPQDRQAYMLEDAAVSVLVTESSVIDRVPRGNAKAVRLDADWEQIERAPAPSAEQERNPEQLAYVIYTSGSTGLPKGVEIPHRALVNFLWTMRDRPGLSADDVLVAVTTLSFDIAGLELYLPLVVGAKVVVAPQGVPSDPRQLAALIADSRATVMQATPTTWRMLLDWGWQPPVGFKALCGGEALPVTLAEELLDRGLELWNMYGPTETTIWSTVAPLSRGEPLTIGRPIANTTVFVLDSRLQPVPPGVAGELHIGGDGLARGYRNRSDLTSERFLESPFGRIYKTGDLVRFRPDGDIEYLGRLDHQVKVRGFRIELGEIETLLARHESVQRAVCVARDDGNGPELVAYVVPRGIPVAGAQLRRYLAAHLPPYMVPSAVVALPSFPLTPNGKVDRKALHAPTRERSSDEEIVAPRTPLERRLTATWERVLGISPIGVTDNFFDLGATSLVAAQLFAQIEHELGNALPLGAVFRAPTIAELAELIERPDASSRWSSLVPIQPHGDRTPIFCVHGGAGTILHLEPLARRLGKEQPFYGLQSRGLYGGAPPLRTVEEMASHYLSELREVQPHGPYVFAGYCFGSIVAYEMAQRMLAEGEEVRLLVSFNGPSPAWIKRWGWFGNQPSHAARRPPRPPRLSGSDRLRRALREPYRFRRALVYRSRRRINPLRARLALALGRPIPEELRERYFLNMHGVAERAYEPRPYPRRMVTFFGEGLYEDPTLGWGEVVTGGIETYAVPGDHGNNRQVMMEPYVEFVQDRLAEELEP